MPPLDRENAMIFRISHIANVPWYLDNGLHCEKSKTKNVNFVPIGMPELINKRRDHPVQIPPNGTLGDYVPFYFTPWSIMMFNIKTGYNNVVQRSNSEIVVLVSSLHKLAELGIDFVFTNGHALMAETDFFSDLADLSHVDWPLLVSRNFKRDPEDPGKTGRYQAEALVYKHLPIEALLGIGCYNCDIKAKLKMVIDARTLKLSVESVPKWYF